MKKRILLIIMLLVLIFSFTASASSPYKSYVYDYNGFYTSAPDAFTYQQSIQISSLKGADGQPLGALLDPADMYVSDDNKIYISDTGNARIVVLNEDYSLNRVIKTFTNTITHADGTTETFEDNFYQPTCTFVAPDGTIYICDKSGATTTNTDDVVCEYDNNGKPKLDKDGNPINVKNNVILDGTSGRIIQFDKDGKLLRVIYDIDSAILPTDFYFQPKSVSVDKSGRIFVINENFTMGLIEISNQGQFAQCLGAPAVTYSPIELIWRFFSTQGQRERSESFIPTEYCSMDIDENGFIYTTNKVFSKATAPSIKGVSKLNAKGKNKLKESGFLPYGDVGARWIGTYMGRSKLTDVISLNYDMYAVLDETRGKVFFYNADGINLFEFGTKADEADTTHQVYINGTQDTPVSLGWLNNKCLVLDSALTTINVYSITDYASMIMQATELHYNNQYDKEADLWKQVLKLNNNSTAAKQSMGKVAYREQNWKSAMKYFRDTYDTENYSKAYKYQRQLYIAEYFNTGALVLFLLIILIFVGKKLYKKYVPPVPENSFLGHLKYSKMVIYRPLHGYWYLVRENHGNVLSATTIMVATAIMSLLQARYTGFIFSPAAEYVNIPIEILRIIAPLMLFCVCNWCVTSLLNGEGNFRSIYISSCYALTPILILYPFAVVLSNIMVAEEGDFYTVFISIALAWVLMLIFAGNMRIHDYSLGMTVLEIFITIVVMILVVFLAILFFALVQQMTDFVSSILQELATR